MSLNVKTGEKLHGTIFIPFSKYTNNKNDSLNKTDINWIIIDLHSMTSLAIY